MSTAQYFRPDEESPEWTLISTTPGNDEGSTLLYVGVGSLKQDIRSFVAGQIDEDPLTARRFYVPSDGVLVEVKVRLARTEGSADSDYSTYTYAVHPLALGPALFHFDVLVRKA